MIVGKFEKAIEYEKDGYSWGQTPKVYISKFKYLTKP